MILANATLVLADETVRGSVRLDGERIAEIQPGATVPAGGVDCEGDYLAPGLIELHTDNLERHMQPRPSVHWPQDAAIIAHDAELASVGVTTVFDALRVGSILSESEAENPGGKRPAKYGKYARPVARRILALREGGHLKISHFLHLRAEICSETLEEELAEFAPEDRIGIVSLMDHTPGQRQFRDTTQMRTYLSGKYAMSDAAIDAHFDVLRGISERMGPRNAARAVAEGRRLGATLASHDDTTVGDVEASADQGCRIAEFPTTEEAASASHRAGIAVIMGAPNYLRGGSHSGNVAAKALAEAGTLDILSSDYAPSSLLMGAVTLGRDLGSLAQGIGTVTAAPAHAAGLDDRGRLAPGLRADLVRFAMAGDFPVVRAAWVRGLRV